jgi:hypothetical protein
MLQINDAELVFTFSDVHDAAILGSRFCPVDSPEHWIRLENPSAGTIRLVAECRFMMYMLPGRYAFALQVSIGGKNAITGEVSTMMRHTPQNYFTTPPQGGIDGYFRDGHVHPFRVSQEEAANQERLEIKVFPMKRKLFDYFRHQEQLIPGPGPSAFRGMTLQHGGERQCEPIYEDLCNLGSWDREHEERSSVCIHVG